MLLDIHLACNVGAFSKGCITSGMCMTIDILHSELLCRGLRGAVPNGSDNVWYHVKVESVGLICTTKEHSGVDSHMRQKVAELQRMHRRRSGCVFMSISMAAEPGRVWHQCNIRYVLLVMAGHRPGDRCAARCSRLRGSRNDVKWATQTLMASASLQRMRAAAHMHTVISKRLPCLYMKRAHVSTRAGHPLCIGYATGAALPEPAYFMFREHLFV
jgi:hypothetical protein